METETGVTRAEIDRHYLAARRRHEELATEMGMAAQALADAAALRAAFEVVYDRMEWPLPAPPSLAVEPAKEEGDE